jgi:hypothetical protein
MNDLTIEKRGPGRPSNAELASRAAGGRLPKSESLARAEARLREIRDHSGNRTNRDVDPFAAPEAPEGWIYEWKTVTVYGKEDPTYQVRLIDDGWTPVPLSRHPEMMPPGWSGATIDEGGRRLMERPKVLSDECRKREARDARHAVLTKESQLAGVKMVESSLNRANIGKHFEPMQISDE